MKITASCPCGAKLVLDDPQATHIKKSGEPDSLGHVYTIQAQAHRFVELHKDHRSDSVEFFR